MQKHFKRLLAATMVVGVSVTAMACGETKGERAMSGGTIGAGAGAAVVGFTGGSVLGGAATGGPQALQPTT